MKVKYIGQTESIYLKPGSVYDLVAIEDGPDMNGNGGKWYRVMTDIDEDYLFLPGAFEILES